MILNKEKMMGIFERVQSQVVQLDEKEARMLSGIISSAFLVEPCADRMDMQRESEPSVGIALAVLLGALMVFGVVIGVMVC